MAFKISIEGRNAQVDGIMSILSVGVLEVRSGTQPVDTSALATGTLLSNLVLTSPAADPASAGSGAFTLPINSTAIATGTIGWGRLKTAGGTVILDGTITLSGGGGDIIASVLSVSIDDIVQILSFQFTAPPM